MRRAVGIALIVAGLLAVPQVTAAQNSCTSAPAAYDNGGTANRKTVVNDPLFSQQWGLKQINVSSAWRQGAFGKGVVIAVIDSGVDLSHPDLRKNLIRGVDLGPEGEPGDCPGPQDDEGHGTHVAGIAAALGDNGVGTIGVAPKAQIMPIRVIHLSDSQGTFGGLNRIAEISRRIAEGIRYAAAHGADVINISMNVFFVRETPGSGISDAIRFAWDKGAVVVAAAGNNGGHIGRFCDYPAADPLALCVGATDRNGDVTPYSNDPAKPTDDAAVLAPGGNDIVGGKCETSDLIWSTFLPSVEWDCGIAGYQTRGGTSMASPYVAGVAALLSGEGLDNREIVECLLETSSNNGAYDRATGYGIVNAGRAVSRCL